MTKLKQYENIGHSNMMLEQFTVPRFKFSIIIFFLYSCYVTWNNKHVMSKILNVLRTNLANGILLIFKCLRHFCLRQTVKILL